MKIKILRGLCLVLFSFLMIMPIAMVSWSMKAILFTELPKPVEIAMKLPTKARIMPRGQIIPGTFKLIVPLEQLIVEANAGSYETLVSYDQRETEVRIQYWTPRGDSSFFYAQTDLSPPENWPLNAFAIGEMHFNHGKIVLVPVRNWLLLGFVCFFSITTLVFLQLPFRKFQKKYYS